MARIAQRQYGVVARRQLLAAGVGSDAIQIRIDALRLIPLHRGVYAVGHTALTQQGRWLAAVLACGPGALLSHRSAGAMWNLAATAGARTEVTSGMHGVVDRRGLLHHRSRRIDPQDRAVRDGIAVTSPARTIVDLAMVLDERRLARAVEAAERLDLFDLTALLDTCQRLRGRRGLRKLRRILGRYQDDPRFTRSGLERRFLTFCRQRGLPMPATNLNVLGYEVDALWPEQRVVVELDTFEFHGSRESFEADRARDADLTAAGHRVVRVTPTKLAQGAELEAQLRRLLEIAPSFNARAIAPS